MIRFLLMVFILVAVGSYLYSQPADPPNSRSPVTQPTPSPTRVPDAGPNLAMNSSGLGSGGVPVPPTRSPSSTSNASTKVASGVTTLLCGIAEGAHDLTSAMVNDEDQATETGFGLFVLVWSVLGLTGLSAMLTVRRVIGKILG